jgi:hypothetical protein
VATPAPAFLATPLSSFSERVAFADSSPAGTIYAAAANSGAPTPCRLTPVEPSESPASVTDRDEAVAEDGSPDPTSPAPKTSNKRKAGITRKKPAGKRAKPLPSEEAAAAPAPRQRKPRAPAGIPGRSPYNLRRSRRAGGGAAACPERSTDQDTTV